MTEQRHPESALDPELGTVRLCRGCGEEWPRAERVIDSWVTHLFLADTDQMPIADDLELDKARGYYRMGASTVLAAVAAQMDDAEFAALFRRLLRSPVPPL